MLASILFLRFLIIMFPRTPLGLLSVKAIKALETFQPEAYPLP